jgi:hypothetical protein
VLPGIGNLAVVEDLLVFGVLTGLLLAGIVGAVASVVVRFRRSQGIERQQMKWFLYAAALLPLFPVSEPLSAVVENTVLTVVLIALPTSVCIAVLRYRFYGIDVVINRTLVYGTLTAILVLAYLGGGVSMQYAFRALTGKG